MPQHEKINYLEYPSRDLKATKQFFENVFDWSFIDYGDQYTAFDHQGLMGGFYFADLASKTSDGAALTVFYSDDLEASLAKVKRHGGKIVQEIFEFPGGRRFHFEEPSGNEFAIWGQL